MGWCTHRSLRHCRIKWKLGFVWILNKLNKRERTQITLNVLFAEFEGVQYFSISDASSAFWQVYLTTKVDFYVLFQIFFEDIFIQGSSAPEVSQKIIYEILDRTVCRLLWGYFKFCRTLEEHSKKSLAKKFPIWINKLAKFEILCYWNKTWSCN